jgi:hypothetical protein
VLANCACAQFFSSAVENFQLSRCPSMYCETRKRLQAKTRGDIQASYSVIICNARMSSGSRLSRSAAAPILR